MSRAGLTDRQKYAAALWRQGEPRREAHRQHLLSHCVPVPKRITMALDYRGLYGPEVDVACGGEEPMVDEWEAGTRYPTAEQMVLLADLTGMLVEWFYDPVTVEMSNGWMCTEDGCQRLGQGDDGA